MRPYRASIFGWILPWAGLALSAGAIVLSAGPPAAAVSEPEGIAAFETVRAVLQHPRCQNCHIPGEAPLQFDEGRAHAQNVVRGPEGRGAPGLPCATCHFAANPPESYGIHMPPGAPNWHLPPPETLPPGVDPPRPISVTFIPASVFDNPALLRVNPEYLAWLLSLPLLESERLLGGNWKIRPAAGLYFKRQWCAVADDVPADLDIVRYWDLAATEKTELNDPDWTVGIKLGRDKNGGYWLLDMVRGRANPGDVDRLLLNTATQDGNRVRIGFGQDPGQAGKSQVLHLVRALSGFTVVPASESGDKLTRFGPFSSQCRAGNVKILRGPWNEDLFRVLEGFPDLAHDDEVDACSGALDMLNPDMKGWGAFEALRQKAEDMLAERKARGEATQPAKTEWAIGSMEWLAEQNKSS